MPHPLENKLGRLRRRLRAMSVTDGLLRLIASVVGVVLLLATLDYVLDINDTGLRLLLSLAGGVAIAASTWRFLIHRLTGHSRMVDVACAIEVEYPSLGSRLSSAIDFLAHDESDLLVGSAALRGSVVDRTTGELASLDLNRLIDVRPVSTAALMALTICLMAGGLMVVDPPAARIALARLIRPFGNDQWSSDVLPRQAVPADIKRLEISLIPPAGTDLPPRDSDPQIRALRGTRAAFSGQFTRSVRRVVLHYAAGSTIATRLSDDGLRFETAADEFVVRMPANYWLEVDDASGTHRVTRPEWRVSVVADGAPAVRFEYPATDVNLPPRARLPIAIRATDNLRVPHVSLAYRRSDRNETGEQIVTGLTDLKTPGSEPPPRAQPTVESKVVRRVGTLWDLAALDVVSGTRIDLTARARDRLGQRAEAVRRVRVVSESTWRTGASARLNDMVDRLQQVIAVQRTVRRHVGELEAMVLGSTTEASLPIHRLRSLPLEQHQIRQMLLKTPRGILGEIGDEIRAWEASGLEHADRVAGLQRAAAQIEGLEPLLLAEIRRALSVAVKTAATAVAWPPRKTVATEIGDSLRKAGEGQALLIEALKEIADRLDRELSSETLAEDLRKIRDAQQRILRATRRRLIDSIEDAAPPAEGEAGEGLARLADQQLALASEAERLSGPPPKSSNELDQLGTRMRQAAQDIEQAHLGRAVEEQEKIAQQLNGLAKQGEASEDDASRGAKSNSLQKKLTRLVTNQRNLGKATEAFGATRRSARPPTRSDLRKIVGLAKQQSEVHGETERVARTPSAAAAVGELLAKAMAAMQQSTTQLEKRETGQETQEWMAQAHQHLEQARTQLASQPPGRQAKQGPAPKARSARQQSRSRPSSSGTQTTRGGRPAGRAGGEHGSSPGSGVLSGDEKKGPTWVKEVWGHLPERMRQQLMQAAGDQFLPKYQVPLETYYRRLSEEPLSER